MFPLILSLPFGDIAFIEKPIKYKYYLSSKSFIGKTAAVKIINKYIFMLNHSHTKKPVRFVLSFKNNELHQLSIHNPVLETEKNAAN